MAADAAPAGVLVTRPAAGAEATMRHVAALGRVAIACPMLAIAALPARLPPAGRVQAVLLTSGNALPALDASLHGVPLFAVGDATAARARAAGFARVRSAAGDAEALAGLVARVCRPDAGALLLPTARGEGMALAAALRQAGFAVLRRAVYAAVPQDCFPAAARDALSRGTVGAALFFSPATARNFVRLLPAGLVTDSLVAVDALALSPAVAEPLASLPWRRIRVAVRPNQDALLTLLGDTD